MSELIADKTGLWILFEYVPEYSYDTIQYRVIAIENDDIGTPFGDHVVHAKHIKKYEDTFGIIPIREFTV